MLGMRTELSSTQKLKTFDPSANGRNGFVFVGSKQNIRVVRHVCELSKVEETRIRHDGPCMRALGSMKDGSRRREYVVG